jgi:dolichol-phosphate mannosyltransferase
VILPTYNERENIVDLISAISGYIKPPLEIIVVDDDSPDKTWEVVTEMQSEFHNVRLVRRTGRRGLATAVAEGVANSSGEILVWMDCDFSHPPSLIPRLIEAIDNYHLVLASRYIEGGEMHASSLRTITSRLICLFARLLLGFSIRDWTSGYIAVRRELLDEIKIVSLGKGYGEYFIAFLFWAKKLGFRIKEIPYTYSYRRVGETKTSPHLIKLLGYGLSYCWCILYLRGKDILFKSPKISGE